MDVINLAYNENDPKKDFSLAFIGMYFKILPCSVVTVPDSLW